MNDRVQVNLRWLYKLRWAAIVGHLTTIAFVQFVLGIDLPWPRLLTIVGALGLSNVILGLGLVDRYSRTMAFLRRDSEWPIGTIMLLDNIVLAALLYSSGGPLNPFTIFFLVNVSLASVLLPAWWAWLLGVMAFLSFSALFVAYVPLPALEHDSPHRAHHEIAAQASQSTATTPTSDAHLHLHLRGMLFAFGAAALFITYFTTRVTKELAERERELLEAKQREAQGEKLEALATLAAGAAHELATPLSTVAVVAHELELALQSQTNESESVHDAKLIRTEVDRCRRILNDMCSAAGEVAGEEMVCQSVQELVEGAIESVSAPHRVRILYDPRWATYFCHCPRVALAQALRAVLRNGIDASSESQCVELSARCDEDAVVIQVRDQGSGMSPSVLRRAGEPFFTTKEAGSGMGLGLFLARRVIERIGGKLMLASVPGEGTCVSIRLQVAFRRDAHTQVIGAK